MVGVSEENKARANDLRTRGDARFAEHGYDAALAAYTESLAVWENPVTRLQIAVTLLRLERYADAEESLELAGKYGSRPFTPEQANQLQSYKKLIAGSVGTIEVYCSEANAKLSLDGRPWFSCPATKARRVDIGSHVITASQPGYQTRSKDIVIRGSSTTRLHIDLRSYEEAYETRHRYPTWLPPTLVGAGAATLVVGLLVARSAWSMMDDYDQRIAQECAVNGCDLNDPAFADLQDLRERAESRETAGTWTMVGGALVMVSGVVLYFTNTQTRHLRVDASPTGVAATASFRF